MLRQHVKDETVDLVYLAREKKPWAGATISPGKVAPATCRLPGDRERRFPDEHSATAPLVFDPEKRSTTRSPGSVRNAMKNFGKSAGKRAG